MDSSTTKSVCGVSELDLFDEFPTQVAVEEGGWILYRPVSALTDGGPIEFSIPGSGDQYIDLRNTRFFVRCKITKADGTELDPAVDKVGPACNFVHTLFKQIDIYLNNVLITNSDNLYAYRAMLETLMTFSHSAVKSQLQMGLFYKDEAHKLESEENVGFNKRRDFIKNGQSLELLGRIHGDLFHQTKYLVNGVDMRLIFNRSADEFSLQNFNADANAAFKVKMEDVALLVRKVDVNPEIRKGHIQQLMRQPIVYPLKRIELKTVSVPAGNKSAFIDNLFLGQKPTRLAIAFAKNSTVHGDAKKNCFNFEHFNLCHLALHSEGKQIPRNALTPNFADKQFLESYISLFTGTNQFLEDTGLVIARSDYDGGFTIYCLDFSPELCRGPYKQPLKRGAMRLEARFSEVLPTTINCILYAEFDSSISIDKDRNVFTDY